ncbi:MFS transporter [Parasphaerochaeta coccoides]|uniref:Major facilitator superfamily MFS_1 n=1 Tax=Parasphaerochaeta coccoides (strain ATCC BAA-1237 / DSM 17374 / SPN1) TaxID=760011 RepID=F4GIS8_PARC1|nr:MFS transporter [Parasphaerochaeta coccoides]AEC02696.1 major facilitator superfamily MFS_1 [Parasphaerochaeta coccoides DSM 17374]
MKNPISVYKGLHKSFYIMALTVFINCAGNFVVVFFSLYLTVRLGYDVATTGLLVSGLAFISIPGSLIGGKLSDLFGRKTIMVSSQIMMGLSYILCGFFFDQSYAFVFIFLAQFFDGITDPARNALEVDITKPEQRQAAFSLLYQALNMGFAIGPLLASFLFYNHPQWLFWGNGIAELVAISLVVLFVPESKPSVAAIEKSKQLNTGEKAESGSIFKVLLARPQLLWFSLASLFIAFAYRQIAFALPLQTTALFELKGAQYYGFMASLNAIIVILFNPFVLAISKKNNVLINVLSAAFMYLVTFALFGLARIPWQFYALTALYTVGEILINNNSKAYQNNNTPMNFRGRFNAILPLFKTTGNFLGPVIGGIILTHLSFRELWLIAAVAVLLAILIYLYLLKRKENAT